MVRSRPAPAIRGYAREYVGWWERAEPSIVRREMPSDLVPLIFNFGSPIRIAECERPGREVTVGSFTTGVFDTSVMVETRGLSGGLQVNLTIPGARLVIGQPLGGIANRIVTLEELLGAAANSLTAQLYDAADWDQRFELMDAFLERRIRAARPPAGAVMRVSEQLLAARGCISIGTLVEAAGCSHRHLVGRFREEIGVTPKVLARVLRFGEAVNRLKGAQTPVRLADLALDCGYYDQAHFDRDCRAFAGVTPSELRQQFRGSVNSEILNSEF